MLAEHLSKEAVAAVEMVKQSFNWTAVAAVEISEDQMVIQSVDWTAIAALVMSQCPVVKLCSFCC